MDTFSFNNIPLLEETAWSGHEVLMLCLLSSRKKNKTSLALFCHKVQFVISKQGPWHFTLGAIEIGVSQLVGRGPLGLGHGFVGIIIERKRWPFIWQDTQFSHFNHFFTWQDRNLET